MLLYVLDAARALEADRLVVVLGHEHARVEPHVPEDCIVVLQEQPLGTGHAVLAAAEQILPGSFVVLVGDAPLITGEMLRQLAVYHSRSGAAATVLTVDLPDPNGYGRVVRDATGQVQKIVEHGDATPAELAIHEVNSGMYVLTAPLALDVLRRVGSGNAQGEIYLTDVIAGLRARGEAVAAFKAADASVVLGVNSRVDLALASRLMARRIMAGRGSVNGRLQGQTDRRPE
jgi:bifunctional UDP-N-acetylglucosamine pyrophosphorylase/glucosamine-1-phosphate N-acetyltransferase